MKGRPVSERSKGAIRQARYRASKQAQPKVKPRLWRRLDMAFDASPRAGGINPFEMVHQPAPGVVPDNAMAMDDSFSPVLHWMQQAGSSLTQEQSFLGYPALAALAQRPEYRRISETIALEMTRKWVTLRAAGHDGDKGKRILEITAEMERLKLRDVFREAATKEGFFGRSHIYIDFGATDVPSELALSIGDGRDETSKNKCSNKKLERVMTVEAPWCYPATYNATDPLRPDWFKPEAWFVMGKKVHASRLLTLIGREVPDMLKPAYAFGGLSLSQMAKPYVDNWLRTRQSVSDLLHSFSVSGIKTKMSEQLENDDSGSDLFKRAAFFNRMRDNRGLMLLDEEEEFFNITTPLSTLDHLQAQSQEHLSSVSGIPLVKLTGISPSGLNASSDGELRCFYDWVHAMQAAMFLEAITRIVSFIQLSKWGEVDPGITIDFVPLYTLTEKEEAEVRKTDADTDEVLIRNKVITPLESRKRVASDPDAAYASLDTNTLPGLTDTEKGTLASAAAGAVLAVHEGGLLPEPQALTELQRIGAQTGIFTTITPELIREAELAPPLPGELEPPDVPQLHPARA